MFLVADGVITDIGAVGTHAVIVSREARASPACPRSPTPPSAFPTGATITVNGSLGTVTIDALP